MPSELPQVLNTYVHYSLDSRRWQGFAPRHGDIIVTTSLKSGTTWMQAILGHLLLPGEQPDIHAASPWLEATFTDVEEVLELLVKQRHRRFIKTHLPLDGLPYYPQVRYIVVGRDARDVFMSLWNHHTSYTEETWRWQVESAERLGRTLERPADIHDFWRDWITKGWFEWESEGYPYGGNLRHTATWWRYRHLGNILFVHYADMLADLRGEIRRVVDFLGIDGSAGRVEEVAEAVTFSNMKKNADRWLPGAKVSFQGGGKTFVFKGTNGRWRGVLSEEELGLYQAAKARELEPESAAWLEEGRSALAGA